MQVVGQAADVVVRLDGAAFQDVGIDGALRQKLDAVLLAGFLFEHADELGADDLALALRLGDARQLIQKAVYRVDVDEVGVHLIAEHRHYLFGLALAQQAVVDVHADEVFADRLDQERRHYGRIDPAGERQQHLFAAYLRLDRLYLFGDEAFCLFLRLNARHIIGALVVFHLTVSSSRQALARLAFFPFFLL